MATQLLAQKAAWDSYVCHEETEERITHHIIMAEGLWSIRTIPTIRKMRPESVKRADCWQTAQVPGVKNKLIPAALRAVKRWFF